MTTPKMSAAAAKFWADQKAADEAYKKWEDQQWQENGQEWTKQGYTRTVDPNNAWGSTWTKSNQPVIETQPPPVDPIKPALVSKTAAQWDALAAEKSGGKYKTMAEVRALQQQMQNAGIDIGQYGPDGKWGDDTQKAYEAYLASQNGAADITSAQIQSQAGVGNPSAQDALDALYYNDKNYTRTRLDDGTFGYRHNITGTMYLMDGKVKDLTGAMGTIADGKITWANEFVPTKTAPGQQQYQGDLQLNKDVQRLFNESVGGKYTWYKGNDYDKKNPQIKNSIVDDPEYPAFLENFKSQYTDNGWLSGWRYSFKSEEDPHLKAREEAWLKFNPKPRYDSPEYKDWNSRFVTAKKTGFRKQGGTMNRVNYFQQGGAAPQQDIQQQVTALVQAAMQGDKKATQTVNQIMEAAKAGDQQATQLAQLIQQVVQQMQGQATAAKWGAKLNYIRSLKYAKGGKTCPTCQKQVEMKACGGKKAKKRYFGGYL